MRRRWWCLAALLWAASASAAPIPNGGQWVYGDNLNDFRATLYENDAEMSLTSATLLLYAINARTHQTSILVGDVLDEAGGVCSFEDIGTQLADPGKYREDFYDCRIVVTRGGETGWSQPFRLSVVKFP